MSRIIETDYLIVGAGAMGMAFADLLLSRSDASLVLVDRRHAPGGHWLDAYPFARLHMPSAAYGVDSTQFGGFAPDPEGDASLFERATATEVCEYYDRVLHHRFLPSGRVQFMALSHHVGGGRVRSRLLGEETTVRFRKLVDATFLEGQIPATSPPPFDVSRNARCVPVGGLVDCLSTAEDYVVIGAGKTGQDACLWLLGAGVQPERIRWVRPRDPWLLPRRAVQPGPGLAMTIEIVSRGIEAAAAATSVDDLFHRLEAAGAMLRIDPSTTPTTHHGAIVSDWQLSELRRIQNVIRLGHVLRIERDRIILDAGEVATTQRTLHVHCAAAGLVTPEPRLVFDGHLITLQRLRHGPAPLSAAIIGYVEATRREDNVKNFLCVPRRYVGKPEDWIVGRLAVLEDRERWRCAPDLADWYANTHLNVVAGLHKVQDDSMVRAAVERMTANSRLAASNMRAFLASANT